MGSDLEIIFRQSAFRHGVTEADIRWAFNTVELDELIQGFENKYRLLGFNTKGNMIEVLYNLINDHRVNVFHAFPCSDTFIKTLSKKE
ncbi:MAG: hypothetical protein FWG99_04675 [Treponema sp.]|nr:hypothetical protein [Treponema sp.]